MKDRDTLPMMKIRATEKTTLADECAKQTAILADAESTDRILVVYNKETAQIYVEHVRPSSPANPIPGKTKS